MAAGKDTRMMAWQIFVLGFGVGMAFLPCLRGLAEAHYQSRQKRLPLHTERRQMMIKERGMWP